MYICICIYILYVCMYVCMYVCIHGDVLNIFLKDRARANMQFISVKVPERSIYIYIYI